jgi:hypothetical protein
MELLFTAKHFIAIFIAIVVIVLVIYLMKKYDLKSDKIIIWTAIIFYVFEVLKQGYWIYSGLLVIQKLPLYPCNMPLYIFPFMIFGSAKIKEFLKPFLYVIFVGGGMLTLLYPSIILGTTPTWSFEMSNFVPFISVVAHAVMIGVGIYLLMSGYYKIRKYDYVRITVVILSMFLVTYVFNKIFGTDFFFSDTGIGLPSFYQDIKEFSEFLFATLVFLTGLSTLYITYLLTLLVNRLYKSKYSI